MEVVFDESGDYDVFVKTLNILVCHSTIQCKMFLEVKKQPSIEGIYQLNTSLTNLNNTALFQVSDEQYLSYDWDFGDGQFSNQINPYHPYQEDRLFQVILKVKDANMLPIMILWK